MEQKKAVWDYSNRDETHVAHVYEIERGILEVESFGIVSTESFYEWFDFLTDYAKKNNTGIKLLSNNNRIQHITPEALDLIPKFLVTGSPIIKIAAVEENIFFRFLLKLYRIPISGTIKVNIFSNEKKALQWLKKCDANGLS